MRPFPFVIMCFLAALCPAQAACSLGNTQFSLGDYSALRASAGTFSVTVRCDRPTDTYRLDLLSPAGSTLAGQRSLHLPLKSSQPGSSLTLLLINQDGLLGTTLQGSRTLRWPLQVDAGQWASSSGAYTLQVGLVLTDAGQASGLGPTSVFPSAVFPPTSTIRTPRSAPNSSGDQP